jgi:ABC-type cobalamin/Fe3+-siderophores transport system ATPase subunit
MRISRIQIQNFRSIQVLDLELPPICAVIGPNNAGKSNLLEALRRVLGKPWLRVGDFDEDDVYGRDPKRDITIVLTLEPPAQYQKYKGGPTTDIVGLKYEYTRYKLGSAKGQRRLEKSCLNSDGDTPTVLAKAPKKGEKHQYAPVVGVPDEVQDQVPLIYLGSPRRLADQLPGGKYSLLRQLFDDIDKDFNDPTQTVSVTKWDGSTAVVPRRERFADLMEQLLTLLKTQPFTELEASIKKKALIQLGFDPVADAGKLGLFFGPFDSLQFYHNLEMRVQETGFSISATELGDGVQNAIVMAILRAFEERRKQGAIILIEEPEMFLHPQMQRSLYRTLRNIGKTNQVIYSTHSPHFVSIPDYQDIALVRRDASGTYVTRSTLPTDAKRRQRLIKEMDPERSELFFARALILVEGDTEKLAFPEYASRLKLDLDTAGVTIVEVGGKRNLKEFAEIAKSFRIPCAVVYDEDSSDFTHKGEEAKFNATLDALSTADPRAKVWRFAKTYEDHLKATITDGKYQEMTQKYAAEAGRSKPVKARLIATEPSLAIPPIVEDVLQWAVKVK